MAPTRLSILHEDERVVAVGKPSGQLVIPGRGVPGPILQAQVEGHLRSKAYVVHRLDREASGLVLFAKDAETHRALCLEFETRKVRKVYLAWVQGIVERDGRINGAIREFGSGRMGVETGGKPSLTRYRVKDRTASATLLELEPETGRRHQLRVHLYSIGHPILGDPLYGKERPVGGAPRLLLHALELSLELAGAKLKLRCDLAPDFARPSP